MASDVSLERRVYTRQAKATAAFCADAQYVFQVTSQKKLKWLFYQVH